MEVGPTESSGLGQSPLSHQELLAWQINMRRSLQPWEISFLRRLSMEWIAESQAAEDPNAPAPYTRPEVSDERAINIANTLRARIRARAH